MENRNDRRYRISPFSGELTYNPHADAGLRRTREANGMRGVNDMRGRAGSPDGRIAHPHGETDKSFLEKKTEFRDTGTLNAEEKGAMLDEAGYPFGRALSFTSPTGSDIRTHDEVVGGGHTIEVQDECINQIGRFQHRGKLADFGNSPNMSENAEVSEPLRDNFGVGCHNERITPSASNSVYESGASERNALGDFMPRAESSDFAVRGAIEEDDVADEKEDTNDEKDRAVTVKSGDKVIKTIVIAGQIEGHTQLPQGQKATRYEELIPQLVEIEESDEIEGLLIILNTVGGDVEAGLALSEMIAGMKKPTASLVLGGGHSIGVPLAVSAKRSFIVPSATMTLHPVRVTGMVLSAPQTYVYLNNMQERIIDFTCSHCNIAHERFYELMLAREEMSTDLGSVLDGKKAVEEGLIDALGTLADAIKYLKNTDSD